MAERARVKRLLLGVCATGAIMAGGVVGGCESETADQTTPPPAGTPAESPTGAAPSAEDRIGNAAERLGGVLSEGRDQAVATAKEGLSDAQTRIAELRERAAAVAEEKRPAYDQAIADAEAHLRNLGTKIEELGKAGADAWQGISADIKAEVAKLRDSLDRAEAQTE